MSRPINVWFVRCPKDPEDKDSSWQPSLHPHIHHKCRTCGIDVGVTVNAKDSSHDMRQGSVRRRRWESIDAAMDRLYANPTVYLQPQEE